MTHLGARAGLKLIERPREVEASLWRRLRFDDEARCRELLFDRYRVLARAIAKGEFRRRPAYGLEKSDFEQLAYSGLLEAIDRFDPERGAPFEAFARPRIRGAISDGVARSSESSAQYSHRRRIEVERLRSLHKANADGDFVAELADLAATLAIGIVAEQAKALESEAVAELDAYETLSWRDMQLRVLKEIEALPDSERSVVQQHYVHGVSFAQIARMLGLSKGRISQLHRAGLMRVRERLRPMD